MGIITYNGTNSNGIDTVFSGTYDVDYEEVSVTVDTSSVPEAPTSTVYTGTSLGGEFHIPQAPLAIPETRIKVADVGGTVPGNTYNITPQLLRCHNGDILCLYTTGTSHYSVEDNIVYKRLLSGDDPATEWGPEVEVSSSAPYGERWQGGGAGVDPETGRVMVISLIRTEAPDYETIGIYSRYSDDHGYTWSPPLDLYPQFQAAGTAKYPATQLPSNKPDPIPFGSIERTSVGLMLPIYTAFTSAHVIFSYDNGVTWDVENGVDIEYYSGGMQLNEPNVVKIDEDNLVLICRDDVDDWKATYSQTTDGGKTWTPFATPTAFFDYQGTSPAGAASCQGMRIGNRVYGFFTAREPVGYYHETCISVDEFLANPAELWNPHRTNALRRVTEVLPSGQNYLNSGYASILPIANKEYTALVAYYAANSNGLNFTDIAIKTMFKV